MPLGHRQQQIMGRLAECGGAQCVEVLVRDLAPLGMPRARERVLRALNKLTAAGLVTVVGKAGATRLGSAVASLAEPPGPARSERHSVRIEPPACHYGPFW